MCIAVCAAYIVSNVFWLSLCVMFIAFPFVVSYYITGFEMSSATYFGSVIKLLQSDNCDVCAWRPIVGVILVGNQFNHLSVVAPENAVTDLAVQSL